MAILWAGLVNTPGEGLVVLLVRVSGFIRGRTRISTSPKGYISVHKSTTTEAIQEGNIEATCQNTFATCERISNKA